MDGSYYSEIKQKVRKNKKIVFYRKCRRCECFYWTSYRRSRYCPKCWKKKGGARNEGLKLMGGMFVKPHN